MAQSPKSERTKYKFTHRKVVTPAAIARFPKVHEPDAFKPGDRESFKITLVFDGDTDLSAVENAARLVAKDCFPRLKDDKVNILIKTGDDINDARESKGKDPYEELAGKITINASCSGAKGDGGEYLYAPMIVGPDKKALPGNMKVWGGDLVKCVLEPIPSDTPQFGTISFRLLAVQLIEKRSGDSGNAVAMFDEEGDGFTPAPKAAAATSDDGDDDLGDDEIPF